MIVIIGASASGKTEIAKVLQSKYNFHKCITTTTRQERVNEVNGQDYHFVSKKVFETLISNNQLVEHAIYNDNYYGLNKADLRPNGLVIMEPNGANQLIKLLKDNVFVVFVNTDKVLRKARMLNRGDKKLAINERLAHDDEIFKKSNLLKVDLEIVNNDQTIDVLAKSINDAYSLKNGSQQ